jgi:N-acetylglucosamine kinase-like BadF-type ATPase
LKVILGIDAGATGTDIMLWQLPKPPLSGWSESLKIKKFKGINFNLCGTETVVRNLVSFIRRTAGAELKNVNGISIGIAGARRKQDRDEIKRYLSSLLKIRNVLVFPDTEIAFASAFNKDERNCGILISGTGSVLYYKNSTGKIIRTGGWGRLIDDTGSGYWIGREGLNLLVRFFDGRLEKTLLAELLRKKFGITEKNILKKIYSEGIEIQNVAESVFDCAVAGDKECLNILKQAAEKLAGHFLTLPKTKAKIALFGSILTEREQVKKFLSEIVKKKFPFIQLQSVTQKPVWGAIHLAERHVHR